MAMLYVLLAFGAIAAIGSLAVDYARVQIVKTQLRAAADAAALAAARAMEGGVSEARSSAASVAAQNFADGTSVVLDLSRDVEFGSWDLGTRVFTPLSGFSQSDASAIRVSAHRTADRGNAVTLTLGGLIGQKTCDVSASAVVTIESSGPGMVGLNYIKMSDKKTNSYKSSKGYPPAFTNRGSIFSNGDITLRSGVVVNGDARPGIGKKVFQDASCYVSGSKDPLTFALFYPMPDPGIYATTNDNAQIRSNLDRSNNFKITGGTLTVAGGNFYVRDFTVGGKGNVRFLGPTTLWVTGTLGFTGGVTTANNLPANLKIRMVGGTVSNTATFSGTTAIYCDYYGPKSPMTVSGNADYYGRIIAQSIDVTGSGQIFYDESCSPVAGGVTIVQ